MSNLSQIDPFQLLFVGMIAYIVAIKLRTKWMVRSMSSYSTGVVVFWSTIVVAATVLIWFGGADALRLVAMAFPEIAIWASTFEITLLVDLFIAAYAVSVSVNFHNCWRILKKKGADLFRRQEDI